MITARMIKIIELLKLQNESSYKKVAKELNLSERVVRYDIDRINEIFESNKFELIKKESKGILKFPHGIDTSSLIEGNYFIYSQDERVSLIRIILIFNPKMLKLNKLCEVFYVSRSTIKNDLNIVEKELSDLEIYLSYKSAFFLEGKKEDISNLMSKEISKYIYLLTNNYNSLNSVEEFILYVIRTTYKNVDIESVIEWINNLLEELNYVLTDQSYKWYVSNILVFIWHLLNNKEYPIDDLEDNLDNINFDIYDKYIEELKDIVPSKLIQYNRKVAILLLNYTSKHDINFKQSYDLNYIEMLVAKLISLMSQEINAPFENDSILYEGLLNHIKPLIDRINRNIYIDDDTISLLSANNIKIHSVMLKVIKEIEILKELKNEDEIVKISIYFMASIYRVEHFKIRNILLVCGLGYGTSNMLKESLLNQYEVKVIDTIPLYKIKSYKNWSSIDIVITTTKLRVTNNIPILLINPILKEDDCKKIESLGITKRKGLINYDSINRKLDFLSDENRLSVINIIKNEIGFNGLIDKSKISKLTDILDYENIKFMKKISTWRDSVVEATKILENRNLIDENYKFDIISGIEKMGFYSVMDDDIALLHGSKIDSVMKSSMSLIVTEEKVNFDGKNVNIIFCLASKDKKEHVPAVISLIRIIKSTSFIDRIKNLKSREEIYEEIIKCELEVMD